jgi:hypothetical protein
MEHSVRHRPVERTALRAAQNANPTAIGAIGQNQDATTHEDHFMNSSAYDANAGLKLLSNRNLNFISIRRDPLVLTGICLIAKRKSQPRPIVPT